MRHKFTPEETARGFKAAAAARNATVKIARKELKLKSKEFIADVLLKVTDPSRLPYIAAFTYGYICGIETEQTQEGAFRQGIEATMAYGLCQNPGSSFGGTSGQVLGASILTAIGLNLAAKGIFDAVGSAVAAIGGEHGDPGHTFGIPNPDWLTAFNLWFKKTFPNFVGGQ